MLFFCTLFVPATYCFVFISGYYGIKFSLEKLLNILSWCLLVSVGVVCFRLFFWHEQIGMKELYRSLFPITTNKWWFMSAFVLLYLLSPCLNLCKVYLNKNQFKILLILLFTFLQFRIFAFLPNAGSDVLGILFVYLLGQYMNKYKVITRKKPFILMLCICNDVLCSCFNKSTFSVFTQGRHKQSDLDYFGI